MFTTQLNELVARRLAFPTGTAPNCAEYNLLICFQLTNSSNANQVVAIRAPGLVMQYVTTFDFIGYLVLFNRDIEYLSVVNGAFRKGTCTLFQMEILYKIDRDCISLDRTTLFLDCV